MFSSRGFTLTPKEGISRSLASYKCVYCYLYTQSYVGLSVCGAKLMEFGTESFCLQRSTGSSFTLLVVIQQVKF